MKRFIRTGLWSVCLCIAGAVEAASFSPVQEMTYCNSDARTVADIPEPNEFTDRRDEWHPNDNYVNSATLIEVQPDEVVYGGSESSIMVFVETADEISPDNLLVLWTHASSTVDITTPLGVEAFAWAGADMVEPGLAVGNFYEIVPEAGESVGEQVTVTLDYWAMVNRYSEGGSSLSTLIHGPGQGDILVTRNCADYDDPQPEEVVYSISRIEADGEYSDYATFQAQIGDVIGLHCGSYANAYTGSNPGYAESSVEMEMYLEVSEGQGPAFEASMADFDGSGVVDLADLALFASVWLQPVGSAPANDLCQNAIELTFEEPVTGSNVGATGGPMDSCSAGADGKDVWYTFTAPTEMHVDVHVEIDDPAAFDSTLSIWDGCDGSQIDCDEAYGSEQILNHPMNQGETIYIRVGGYDGPYPDEGTFTVSVTPTLV